MSGSRALLEGLSGAEWPWGSQRIHLQAPQAQEGRVWDPPKSEYKDTQAWPHEQDG